MSSAADVGGWSAGVSNTYDSPCVKAARLGVDMCLV